MASVGIIVEYNPFHNGHLYQINKIKEMYPNKPIIVILNGYFLERGLISLGATELTDILNNDHKCEITCNFCNKKYIFDENDLKNLIFECNK